MSEKDQSFLGELSNDFWNTLIDWAFRNKDKLEKSVTHFPMKDNSVISMRFSFAPAPESEPQTDTDQKITEWQYDQIRQKFGVDLRKAYDRRKP